MGFPIYTGLLAAGLYIQLFVNHIPPDMIITALFNGICKPSLLAIPFFLLAGGFMEHSSMSSRLVGSIKPWLKKVRGGVPLTALVANEIFGAMSGSAPAATATIGRAMLPAVTESNGEKFALGLLTSCGAIAIIMPPSINMIVYASLTGFSTGKLFIGGIVPGIIIGLCLMGMCYWYANKYKVDLGTGTFDIRLVWKTFKKAFFALIMPFIIIGGVTSGFFTATESGIIACLYGLVCGFFIYRTLQLRDLYTIFKRATASSAMLMMLMGMANIYSYIFARENLAGHIKDLMTSISTNPTVVVLIIIAIMLVIGCFMETLAATAVILPIVYPIITNLGVDPLMFAVLYSIATVVGALTPPVGLYLFMSMNIAEATFQEAIRYSAPVILIILATMGLIMIFPQLVTFLPNLLMWA